MFWCFGSALTDLFDLRLASHYMDYRTEDYEKSFIERYLERTANLKIEELLCKIKECRDNGNTKKIHELEIEIQKIKRELVADKAIVLEKDAERKNVESKETLDFGWDTSCDDWSVSSFNSKYLKAASVYCRYNNIPEDKFEEDLRRRSESHGEFTTPRFLWSCLFPYQQDGVKWLLGLYRNNKGGILADDMGLGKTVQVIGFLATLFNNDLINNALVLCPATVLQQWLSEWKKFYPFVRIFCRPVAPEPGGVYLFSYEKFKMMNRNDEWDVVILDEGHRIKNKDAKITLSVKRLRAGCRFVLSGTPIQNNLGELWSIFDFVNHGLLGSYTSFYEEFEEVISMGGYGNASTSQVEKSYKHSLMLRSLIEPYILRRVKSQVSHKLPSKMDKIIFCSLTAIQIQHYNRVLESKHVMNILSGKGNLLSGICMLRKVCNHPRLLAQRDLRYGGSRHKRPKVRDRGLSNEERDVLMDGVGVSDKLKETPRDCFFSGQNTGSYDLVESSCKMRILVDFLKTWKCEENKVLIFSQTVEMLNIIEECVEEYKYLRMDGSTPTPLRSELVARFNEDDSIFVFLLTTRVGGLGLNLVGASRIVIYDPDWNPSTDVQAKERAWRYGQKKDVEIYRFVCKDTIEEKIYQKQIFKDMLGKKVLSNPRLNRFFNKSCMDELFSFSSTSKEMEIKIHESHGEPRDSEVIKEVRARDHESFSRMKLLNEKKTLSGSEVLEYIRLREGFILH